MTAIVRSCASTASTPIPHGASMTAGSNRCSACARLADPIGSASAFELCVSSPPRLLSRLDEHQVGDTVKLTVRRDGKDVEITVTLSAGA